MQPSSPSPPFPLLAPRRTTLRRSRPDSNPLTRFIFSPIPAPFRPSLSILLNPLPLNPASLPIKKWPMPSPPPLPMLPRAPPSAPPPPPRWRRARHHQCALPAISTARHPDLVEHLLDPRLFEPHRPPQCPSPPLLPRAVPLPGALCRLGSELRRLSLPRCLLPSLPSSDLSPVGCQCLDIMPLTTGSPPPLPSGSSRHHRLPGHSSPPPAPPPSHCLPMTQGKPLGRHGEAEKKIKQTEEEEDKKKQKIRKAVKKKKKTRKIKEK